MSTRPTIGVLSPFVGGFYYGGMIHGIAQAAAQAGVRLLAIQTDQIDETARGHRGRDHIAGWGHIQGCIVISQAVLSSYGDAVRNSDRPIVAISGTVEGITCPIVQPDNRSGMRDAVRHLIEHGHRRIAFSGMFDQLDFRERHEAYEQALREAGIEPDPALVYRSANNTDADSLDLQQGRQVAGRMLAQGMPSTAIVGGDDEHALGIMQALVEAGLTLPRDQAIVGFDDIDGAAHTTPSLSSVRQDFGALGRLATTLLLDKLAGKPVADGRHEVPTSFVVRESCGCSGPVSDRLQNPADRSTPASRQRRLSARLEQTLRHDVDAASRVAVVGYAAPIIASAMESSLGSAAAPSDEAIRDVANALYKRDPRGDTVQGVVAAVHEYVLEILAGQVSLDSAATARLAASEAAVMLGLTTAQSRHQFDENTYLQVALSTQYDVAVDLLRSDEEDPRSLRWLESTAVRGAQLATWSDDEQDVHADGLTVQIVGTFERDRSEGSAAQPATAYMHASDFPPAELLALADDHPDEIVMLLPVRLNATDWGLLGAVGPVDRKVASGREGINQWTTLLAVALDRQAKVASLERAYAREQRLVEDVRISGERFALAAEAASGGLWDWDVVKDTVYYSPRWNALLDLPDGAVGSDIAEWFGRVHPDDLSGLRSAIDAHVTRPGSDLEIEHRIRLRDGSYLWVMCRALVVRDAAGKPIRMVGSLTDVHDRKQLEQRLRHDALYDSLTGLPNRSLFLDRLRVAMARATRRPGCDFAVLFLDLDGFKLVNDSLGHLLGDSLLSSVAERIAADLRPSDTAARFGGDEFAILLDDVALPHTPAAVAERLQARLALPFHVGGHEIVVTASIGIASSITGHETAEDVLRDADTAMYRAKADGKGTHATFDTGMHARAVSRLQIETELRHALDADELRLHYQPIISIDSGKTVAVEALVRWEHPTRGLLSPADFLPVAEETGLIVPMGKWIVAESCRQLARWRDLGASADLRVSVNVSNRQFWHGGLLKDLHNSIRSARLVPRDI
ncbi:MAG: hypothetical protein QOH29_636, partial [Actinomycetota bacterium]|nr:hypothetical protein [Actinomycetota bacterium]